MEAPPDADYEGESAVNLSEVLTMTLGPTPWLVAGLILLGFNLLIPDPTTSAFGLSGVMTSLLATQVPLLPNQLLIWGTLSAALTLIMRFSLPKESRELEPAKYARVCDVIAPGQVGRVHYEGAIWHARCQISDVAIASDALVAVVERQGNTLIVMPIPTSPSTRP